MKLVTHNWLKHSCCPTSSFSLMLFSITNMSTSPVFVCLCRLDLEMAIWLKTLSSKTANLQMNCDFWRHPDSNQCSCIFLESSERESHRLKSSSLQSCHIAFGLPPWRGKQASKKKPLWMLILPRVSHWSSKVFISSKCLVRQIFIRFAWLDMLE